MNRKSALFVLIFAVYILLAVRYFDRGPSRHYSDFRVYHTTAVRFLAGENIYDTTNPAITPFKYSPMFALLISPLGLLPIHEASLIFFSLNFALLLGFFVLSKKLVAEKNIGFWKNLILYLVPFIFVLRFALLVLDSGQVNLLMLSFAAAGLYLVEKKKDWAGGAFLALSVMVKYVTFIFIPYWIIRKKWKAVFSSLLFMAIYCYLPALVCGFKRAHFYLMEWMPFITKTSLDRGSWTDYKNQSVYSWVIRHLLIDPPYRGKMPCFEILNFQACLIVAVVLALFLYAAALYPAWKKRENPAMTYAALFTLVAILNPNCWPFNFVALYLPVMALTEDGLQRNPRHQWVLFLGGAAFLFLNGGGGSIAPESFQYFSELMSFMTLGSLLIFLTVLGRNQTQ